ncbi:hypothetical protein OROGR_025364 [Orobanche gracilis]
MAGVYISFSSLILVVPLSLLLLLYFIVRPKPVRIPIKSRHVFITGGSSGIGLALAHLCASHGAVVSLLARNVAKLEESKQSIKIATGRDVRVFSADVRDYEAVKRAVEEAGPIDVLVCNHGVFSAQEMDEQAVEEIRFMVDVNLIGTFHLIKAALPGMKKDRAARGPGSIAIMSSQAGQVGIYGYSAYSASKFGLRGLAEALQQEIIAEDIHVSLIFPPDTETPGLLEVLLKVWTESDLSLYPVPLSGVSSQVLDRTIKEQGTNTARHRLIKQSSGLSNSTKTRPQLTNIIAASSGAMIPDEVARKSLKGIQSATFMVPCNVEGFLLSAATAGLSPQRSYLMAFVEVMAAGVLRLAGLFFQWNWYRSIAKWHAINRTQ